MYKSLFPVDSFWHPLPITDAFISTRVAGDLGPSGHDLPAIGRRSTAFANFPGGIANDSRPNSYNSLICRQTHSLRVLALLRGKAPLLISGTWDASGQLIVESTALSLPGETLAGQRPGSSLSEWVGSLEADGILTDEDNWWIGVTVADCLPILLRGNLPDARVLRGALHSGWSGTGILAVALAFMAELELQGLAVHLGPCIAGRDYAVPLDRAQLYARRFGEDAVVKCLDGQPGLDLIAANRALLNGSAPCLSKMVNKVSKSLPWAQLGTNSVVGIFSESTYKTDWMHSYRRDGATNYGRMLCMIGPSR